MPERRQSRRLFERCAESFDRACFVHEQTRSRLLQRLDYVAVDVKTALDLGSALGAGTAALAERYPGARVIAVDTSMAMLAGGQAQGHTVLAADAESLPFADRSAELVFANMLLPWCQPPSLFAEVARVLDHGGLFLFATLGPDSLKELRQAWYSVDEGIHVHGFADMHDIGDLLVRSGLREPVMDVDRIEVTYAELGSLVRDLRECGATNTAAGRSRGLTAPGNWRRFAQALSDQRRDGRMPVTVELIFGQAWGRNESRVASSIDGEVAVPLAALQRRHVKA